MATETQEDKATQKALDELAKWMAPGNQNEAITFQIARLTDPLAPSDSLIGAGDCSTFTPKGKRGTLQSTTAAGFLMQAGAAHMSPSIRVDASFDLTKNIATVRWTPPGIDTVGGKFAFEEHFALELDDMNKKNNTYFFHGGNASGASYGVTFALL